MSESRIITVTLNPSLDETITVSHLNLGYHNVTADTMRLDASGRGVNVSQALQLLDIKNHAMVLLGNDAIGHAYKGLLTELKFDSTIVRHEGHTRSDTIIFDQSEDNETHIIDEGVGVSDDAVEKVIDKLKDMITENDTVILAGNLPRNLRNDTYARIARVMDEVNARVVVMTGHEALEVTLKSSPELVAVTRLEMEAYFNYPVRTFSDMVNGCQKLVEQGAQAVVTITDSFDGAVFATADAQLMAQMNTEKSGTDSGVADSMVAGYLAGIQQGKSQQDAFQLGAAAVIFAAEEIGNNFGTMEELQVLIDRIVVSEFDASLDV